MIFVWFLIAAAVGYFVGSLNYSIIFSKLVMHSDVRTKGSGNAGSTNMMRSFGWGVGVSTLIVDFLKTFVATFAIWALFSFVCPDWRQTGVALCGLCCVLGHCFPVFFKFKGGKGVAVGGITSLMVDWRCFVIIVITFLVFTAISKYVSLGSVMGALAFPASLPFFTDFGTAQGIATYIMSILTAGIIIILHRKNIVRIVKGEEHRLTFKKK